MDGRPAGISDGESDDDDFGEFETPLPKLRSRPQQFNGGVQKQVSIFQIFFSLINDVLLHLISFGIGH